MLSPVQEKPLRQAVEFSLRHFKQPKLEGSDLGGTNYLLEQGWNKAKTFNNCVPVTPDPAYILLILLGRSKPMSNGYSYFTNHFFQWHQNTITVPV